MSVHGIHAILATWFVVVFFHHLHTKKEDILFMFDRLQENFRCFLGHWIVSKKLDGSDADMSSPMESMKRKLLEEEMNSIRIANFAVVAKPFLHITWFSILGQIIRAAYQLNSLHYMWVATCTLTYAVLWEAEHRPFTPDRSRYVCIFLHFAVIFGNMACFAEDWDKMICTHAAHVLFHLNLATIMSDLWSSIPLSLCFCASTVLCYISVYGWASISNEFMMLQFFQLVAFMVIPGLIQAMAQQRIDMALQSKGDNLMITGFRRVIKGLCDGDLLLDSDFRVCGSATCLQRLLGTQAEFVGLPLCDWMEAESQQPFVDFIAASSAEGHDASAPRCLRVAFKAGEGASVSVDLFHVAIPDLQVPGGKHHLLALAEDARPLPDAEVEDCPASQRSGLERPARDEAGDLAASLTSVSADCIQAFKELVELNLFLDPYQHGREDDSLLDDVLEAHFKFQRQETTPHIGRGMPTLRRFVHPRDWEMVDQYLEQVVSRVRTSPTVERFPALDLGPLLLRLPGEAKSYIYAKCVTVSLGSEGVEEEDKSDARAQPVERSSRLRIHLQVSEFYTGEA